MTKLNIILIVTFVLFTAVPMANAIGVYVTDSSSSFSILVGNISQTYNLSVTMNSTDLMNNTNLTITMPYGIEVTTPGCVANVTTITTLTCVQMIPTAANTTANLTVKANLSAYSTYGNLSFNFSVTADATPSNSTVKSVFGVNFWRNPRPYALANGMSGNQTLRLENWNQTDSTYKIQVPIWTFNVTSGRPQLANNTYGDVMYFDKSFFEMPSYMRLWSFNLSFRIIYGGQDTSTFYIRSPINNSNETMSHQTLVPILMQTSNNFDPMSNTTRNFTIGVPSASGSFSVFLNNTKLTDQTLRNYGINMAYSGGDQSSILLTITVNSSNLSLVNNTEMYVMFTTMNMTACTAGIACPTSPVYVTVQKNNGLDFDRPPKFGSSLNISFLVNVTNRLTNYTLQDMRLSFMQPMNVTVNQSGTISQFNMTLPNQIKLQTWNSTGSWEENLSLIRTDSNLTFTEGMGPGAGATINLFVSTFDVLLSNNSATFSNWDPATNGNNYAYVNFTAEMVFPAMEETALPSGNAGTNNSYNVTANNPVQSFLNITEKVPGLNSSSTGVVVSIDGSPLASANYTIGSLVVNVPSGQHSISVSYVTPAASSTSSSSTSTSSSSSSGGAAPTTSKQIHTWQNLIPDTQYILDVTSNKIPVDAIEYEVMGSVENAKITVESLTGKPADISADPPGTAYYYLSILTENLANNLAEAKIKFSVDNSWLEENDFDPNDVVLQRFVGTIWQKLVTTPLGENGTKYGFEAITPGFSIFVITAEVAPVEIPQSEPEPTVEEPIGGEPQEIEGPAGVPKQPSEPDMEILIAIATIAFIAIIGYLHYHHGKPPIGKRKS